MSKQIQIFTRPRMEPMYTSLQAKRSEWERAVATLQHHNKTVYADLINRHLNESMDDVVVIKLTDAAADALLRLFGLSS